MHSTAEIYKFPSSPPGEVREKRGPQVEDGYTRIANELLEALCHADFTAREFRVVHFVIRQTYGWNDKAKRMASTFIAGGTGLHESDCSKVLNELIRRKVVIRHGGSRSPVSLNKHFDEWLASESSKKTAPVKRPQSGQDALSQSGQDALAKKDRKDINPLTTFEGGACDAEHKEKQPAQPKAKSPAKTKGYSEEFEACWQVYPKREGSNPKNRAFTGWKARLKEGVTEEEMTAGVQRYAAYVRAKGDEGTPFVMQAQRFFGASREFENAWGKPAPSRDERPNPYASRGDCDGQVYIPGRPADSDEWRARR